MSRNRRSNEDHYTATLCQAIKDHSQEYALRIAREGAEEFLASHVHANTGVILERGSLPTNNAFGILPLRITITKTCKDEEAKVFKEGLRQIRFSGLQYDLVDGGDPECGQSASAVALPAKPSTNVCKAIDMVKRAMEKLGVHLYRGHVYKKAANAKYTFVKSCTVLQFLHSLLCNSQISNFLTPCLPAVNNIISYKGCNILRQLSINYDLVEVKPYGRCFSFKEKCVVDSPLKEDEIGKVTPRAYVSYTWKENVVPLPRLFVSSLRNSMPDENVLTDFLVKWYQLALKGQFPQKTRKLCCVGDADSGKTSWFAPYEGIISHDKLATVTRDRHFATSMLSEETECLFVDEWPPDAMSADDAKRDLQGGFLAMPQKHKEPTNFVYNSGAYITCNQIPNFSDVDDVAIRARLAVFETRSLPTKNANATNWLRRNCMQCFHYVSERLKNVSLWENNERIAGATNSDSDEGALYNDFTEDQQTRQISRHDIEELQFSQSFSEAIGEA